MECCAKVSGPKLIWQACKQSQTILVVVVVAILFYKQYLMWHEMKIEKEMVKLEPANWQLSKVRCWAIVKRSHDNSADLQPNLAL